jgi:hypothetical protein
MSRRSKRLWFGACLAPASVVAGLIAVWLNDRLAHPDANGFIERSVPMSFIMFGVMFYVGAAFALCALVSTAIDYEKSKRGKIAGTNQNNRVS